MNLERHDGADAGADAVDGFALVKSLVGHIDRTDDQTLIGHQGPVGVEDADVLVTLLIYSMM